MKQTREKRIKLIILIICLIIGGIIISKSRNEMKEETITYTELLRMINEDQVSLMELKEDSNKVIAYSKTDDTVKYNSIVPNTYELTNYVENKIEEGQDIDILMKEYISMWEIWLIIWGILVFIYVVGLIYRIKKGTISSNSLFGSHSTSCIEKITDNDVRFSDVAGLDEEKEELIEIVDFLKNPEKYTRLGAKIPKGVLMSGLPGTGKTLLAKAIAGEAGVTYLAVSGSEFIEKYVGVGAARIRDLFEDARNNAPCIIFIDEIDAIGAKRNEENSSEHNHTLEQLLIELDGFEDRDDIILLGATNRVECLDPALTRPGRFDRKININLPDVKGREEIIKLHGKDKPFTEEVDFKRIAYNTAGFSGAELANLLNESAILAAREDVKAISQIHIDEAMKKIIVGVQKSRKVISEDEKFLVANHEAGHAVVSLFLETQSNVKEVSIISRGSAGGYTLYETVEEGAYRTKTDIKESMVALMAGRVAEKIVLGDISTGASNDLEVATKLARDMVIKYGMDDEIGPISFLGCSDSELEFFGDKILSNTGNIIAGLLREAEENAEKLINKHRALLDNLVEELLQEETISGDRLKVLFDKYNKDTL